ncbi:MAG: hypothetical protein E4H10_16385 [Bacteroidia bacterium]|nr:MAG: hypothetical protein E4H10_16385 [Bacteroidia bacterium]
MEYTHLTPTYFRSRLAEAPIAYLPLGTLEWHGEHLPVGSDGLQSFSFMKDMAREIGGIVLPMLYLGQDIMTDHAASNESSLMMYCYPELPAAAGAATAKGAPSSAGKTT